MSPNKITAFLLVLLSIFSLASSAAAMTPEHEKVMMQMSEQERKFLLMYFDEDDLFVMSTTRSLKSISRIAENVEVVTADDIELMNAHTVAEALFNVTGIEMWDFSGPGANGYSSIHSADHTRIAVFLDGVPLRNEEHAVVLGILPVQMIERIEVIKGPASSTWGSSFGGVINIITKSVRPDDHIGGSLYSSGGEHSTSDLRAEVYGRKDNVGIYIYAGTLNSDGLINSHDFWHNNLFTKLTLDAGKKTKIDLAFFYHKGDSVQWDYLPFGDDTFHSVTSENIYSSASITTALRPDVDLSLSAWMYLQNDMVYEFTGADERLWDANERFDKYGMNGSLTWRTGLHTIVVGTDMFNGRFKWELTPNALTQREYALFINDTINIGTLGIAPGLRYDDTNVGGNFVSPSLGITWMASTDVLLRADVSRGFHDPMITDVNDSPDFIGNPGIRPEKIWSYQAGAEVNILDAFKAKATLFFHDITDMILDKDLGDGMWTRENAGKVRTTGGELEISTKEYKGFTLKGGFHYERMKLSNFSTDRTFDVSNRNGLNTALTYKGQGLRAILQGHYMWWNLPGFWEAKYNGVIMDFNVIKEILKTKSTTLEAFFTGHNILNGASYNDILVKNPGRWIEAGLRYRF